MSLDIDMTLNSEVERPCNLPSWLNLTSRSAIGWYKIYNTANVLLVIPRIAPNSTRTVWSRKMSERDSNPRVTTLPELRRRFRRSSHSDLGSAQHSSFPDTLRTISPQHGHKLGNIRVMSGGTPDGEGKKEREEFILHNSTKKYIHPPRTVSQSALCGYRRPAPAGSAATPDAYFVFQLQATGIFQLVWRVL